MLPRHRVGQFTPRRFERANIDHQRQNSAERELLTKRLAGAAAHLAEWSEIMEIALRFGSNCAASY